jgi:PAS domain S-box-containing protein
VKVLKDFRLALGMATIVGVFVAAIVISLFTFRRLNEATQWVVHTQDVLLALKAALNETIDAETAQRAYIISGKPEFLEPYNNSHQRIDATLNRLQKLVADNPQQLERVGKLRSLIKQRMEHLGEVIELRDKSGFEAARTEVERLRGKALMDEVRNGMQEMESAENGLLAKRTAAAHATTTNTLAALYTLAFLTVCILAAGYLYITRQREFLRVSRTELARTNAQLQNLLNSATQVGVIYTDVSGTIRLFNPGAERLLGYRADEVVDKYTPAKFHLDSEAEAHSQQLSEALGAEIRGFETFVAEARSAGSEEREWTYIRKDGSRLTGLLTVTPVRTPTGELTGFLGIIADVTQRRRAEEELRRLNRELAAARDQALEASRLKSAFLANMSHELRTPLNGIIGFSEILLQEPIERLKDHLKPSLEKIHRSGRHLLALINDILDLSKIEAGKMTLNYDRISVYPLVAEVANQLREQVEKNGNQLEIHCDPSIGEIKADPVRVQQILYNLLSNAGKFTKNGNVRLEITPVMHGGQHAVAFAVEDTGIGMSAEEVGRLFQDFMQADSSTTRKYGGTGLGLAISRRFCQMMGGTITVTSEQGKGSRFTAILPRDGSPDGSRAGASSSRMQAITGAAAPLRQTTQHIPGGSSTVLSIDDDEDVLTIIASHLQREGLTVYTTTSGEEGLRLAKELRPDVITLDVMMPQLDGWTLLNQLKLDPATAEIPVVMLTMLQDKEMGFSLGAADYIMKPVQAGQLLEVLRKYRKTNAASGRVLLVEDDSSTREVLRRFLQRENWIVDEAENGNAGLSALAVQRPDLVLLDLMMPEMDGFEFVTRMRERPEWTGIPVIVVTAKDVTPEDRIRLNGNVQKIMEKGVHSRDQIMAEVKRVAVGAAVRAAGGVESTADSSPES